MRITLFVGLLATALLAACGPKPPPCTGEGCAAPSSSSQAGGAY